MNREILFKAKRKDNGEWVEGNYVYCRKRHYILPALNKAIDFDEREDEWIEVNPDTFCQYTGLTDKNGKKIWENDICKITSDTLDGYEYFICRYENKNARYVFECNNVTIEFGDIYPYEIEVIGNIFNHTDLLEVE